MSRVNFSSNFDRELQRVAQDLVDEAAKDHQKLFDSLGRRYKGRPVPEVKNALRREWRRLGGDISDPDLTDYATLISEGTRIKMRT